MENPPLVYPGVYAFFAPRQRKPVYIGESGDVVRRYKEHRKKKWFSEDLEFRAVFCADPETRLVIETVCILAERPQENKVIKVGLSKSGRLYSLNFIPSRKDRT